MTRAILIDQDERALAKTDYVNAQYVRHADFINDVAEAGDKLFAFMRDTARDTSEFASATSDELQDVADARDRFVTLLDAFAEFGTHPLLDGDVSGQRFTSNTTEVVRFEPSSADMRPVAVGVLDYLIAMSTGLRNGVLSGEAIVSDFFLAMASLDLAKSWLNSIVGFHTQTRELDDVAVATEVPR